VSAPVGSWVIPLGPAPLSIARLPAHIDGPFDGPFEVVPTARSNAAAIGRFARSDDARMRGTFCRATISVPSASISSPAISSLLASRTASVGDPAPLRPDRRLANGGGRPRCPGPWRRGRTRRRARAGGRSRLEPVVAGACRPVGGPRRERDEVVDRNPAGFEQGVGYPWKVVVEHLAGPGGTGCAVGRNWATPVRSQRPTLGPARPAVRRRRPRTRSHDGRPESASWRGQSHYAPTAHNDLSYQSVLNPDRRRARDDLGSASPRP
jgi:hypothetical protein